LLPGDVVSLTCDYDTSDRNWTTSFGLSTHEEMCAAYLFYYPKTSSPELCIYGNFTGLNWTGPWNSTAVYCGLDNFITDWQPPTYAPYQPPACTRVPPPIESPKLNKWANLSQYERSEYLDDDNKYKLYWTADRENQEIHAAVEVETAGWVGLGISEGGMIGSDVLIGWVKDGQVYFEDRFATEQALPPVDKLQDYYNVQASEIHSPKSVEVITPLEIAGVILGALALFSLVGYLVHKKLCSSENMKNYRGLMDDKPDDKAVEMLVQPSTPPTSNEGVVEETSEVSV